MSNRGFNPDTIWVCNTCGSQEVEERVWRDCNTGECSGIGESDGDDCWCRRCESSCEIADIDDYKTTQDEKE